MANALTPLQFDAGTGGIWLDQALHGYAEGHRLLESSISIPDDLKRLMLRMSDLSGSSVMSGFQDYLTGYPLPSLDAYALARTWYAAEMSRPGCVWTHSFIIPSSAMTQMTSLSAVRALFRRPDGRSISEAYSKAILLESDSSVMGCERDSEQQGKIQAFIAAHYQKDSHSLIIPAANSDEYADLIFAVWSQKWPTLRMSFTFCTGSLSARIYENSPLEVQCVPMVAARQVSREIAEAGFGEPTVIDFALRDLPRWTILAADDALQAGGGAVRSFLWSVGDKNTTRSDFESFLKVYEGLEEALPLSSILELTADLFPRPTDGHTLKRAILGDPKAVRIPRIDSKAMLLALATTDRHQSFDADQLFIKEQASRLLREQPTAGCLLLGDLFRASLNPIGDEILNTLILAMRPEDALQFAGEQQQFLPGLFRANANLATSAQLWRVARDRKRELFESIAAQPSLEPEVVRGIIDALLDSNSDAFIGRAFTQWGTVAVLQTLDWIEAHGGSLTEGCRAALTSHVPDVMTWVGTEREKSTAMLAALAHVVAPHASQIARHDSRVWLRALHALRKNHRGDEENYMCAFVLALALCNAPPAPLDLVSESFERVHRLAEKELLRDDAWLILQPLVPELSWRRNWDKCERMRRALVSAFVRYAWPAPQLRDRITNPDLLEELLKSARKIDIDYYFRGP